MALAKLPALDFQVGQVQLCSEPIGLGLEQPVFRLKQIDNRLDHGPSFREVFSHLKFKFRLVVVVHKLPNIIDMIITTTTTAIAAMIFINHGQTTHAAINANTKAVMAAIRINPMAMTRSRFTHPSMWDQCPGETGRRPSIPTGKPREPRQWQCLAPTSSQVAFLSHAANLVNPQRGKRYRDWHPPFAVKRRSRLNLRGDGLEKGALSVNHGALP